MAIIQAVTRKIKYAIDIIALNVVLVFQPNEKGDVVCEVVDEAAQDWLLSHTGAFRLYGEQPEQPISAILTAQVSTLTPEEPSEVSTLTPDDHPHVMKDEDGAVVLDLRPLSDDELHAFAVANAIKVHPKAKGDTIRDKIAAFLTAEA